MPISPYISGKIPDASSEHIPAHGIYGRLVKQSNLGTTDEFNSPKTVEVMDKIRDLRSMTQLISTNYSNENISLYEQLFDARSDVKILLSQLSMHYSAELREKLFRQIDLIHDPEDWEEGDDPIQLQSFKTFLRWFFINKPVQLPNFGLSAGGNFIASWVVNHKDTLILELLSRDRIKWFVTKYYDEEVDHSSGLTNLSRIAEVLAPYHSEDWFTKEV